MDQLAEVRAALLALRTALNRNGEDIDIRINKINVTSCGDQCAKFSYSVSAKQTQYIDL